MSILIIGVGAFLLFCLQLNIYKYYWHRRLEVGLRFQENTMFEGEENSLLEVIENKKPLPLPMLKVKFQTSKYLQFSDSASAKVTDRYYRNNVFHIGGRERITNTALKSVRIFLNPEDKDILRQEETVEAAIRIAAGLAKFFLNQGIKTAFYSNGVDIITGKQIEITASAGRGQMEAVNRALARMDTEKNPTDFQERMEKILLQEEGGTMTFLVALHAYEEFLSAVRIYKQSGKEFRWLYPVREKGEPNLPWDIEPWVYTMHMER